MKFPLVISRYHETKAICTIADRVRVALRTGAQGATGDIVPAQDTSH